MQKKLSEVRLDAAAIRAHHRRVLLQLLRSHGPLSRRDLSRASGLSPAAVMNVVVELVEAGLAEEEIPVTREARVGRPSTDVALAAGTHHVLALQIGAGFLQAGVVDLTSQVVASEQVRFPVPTAPDAVLALADELLQRVMSSAGITLDQVLGLGVGVAGIVDAGRRINISAPTLGWTDVPIADHFERTLGVDVVLDHNVRAMAAGESRYGTGQGLESLAFVYVRTGVGAGLILGGAEYRGGTHGAVEIGHLRVEADGPVCTCGGRGCLETLVSDGVLRGRMIEAGLLAADSAPDDRTWTETFVAAVKAGDPQAAELRDDLVRHLSTALLNLVSLLNPQQIVLGGLLFDLAPVVVEPVRAALVDQVMPVLREGIRVDPPRFGADAGMIGAATIALDSFVFGPPLLPAAQAD
ncbi:ROK family transcriptional regulator [Microbacterium sp. p3-SID336]|uniref:ROK family transcriptional regulator n=1 Tax=Microbacterium sp. p3-SID336 TaxID=2916212 RepID=UPI0021A6BCA9|nr:ROK family transcriptional regulator [Microbacterium sp. p3-SID336]MCT1477874.1 ROK family transcriptional regulator [Microbacterium sp. p3-SID336]